MRAWWISRSVREQRLMLAAATLLAFVLVLQLVVGPVLRARADARVKLQDASQTAAMISQLEASRPVEPVALPAGPVMDADTARTETATLAAGHGLTVSRIQTGTSEQFGILIDDADPAAVFAWLKDSETRTGMGAAIVSMSETRNGRVRVSVDFVRTGTP